MSEAVIEENLRDGKPATENEPAFPGAPGLYRLKIDRGVGFWEKQKAEWSRLLEQEHAQIVKIEAEIETENQNNLAAKIAQDNAVAAFRLVILDQDSTDAEIDQARKDLKAASKDWWKLRARILYLEDILEKHNLAFDRCERELEALRLNGPFEYRIAWASDAYADYEVGQTVPVWDLALETKEVVIASMFDFEERWANEELWGTVKYDARKHGYRLQRRLHGPASLALNLVSMPAIQQERPKYRAATVLSKDAYGLKIEYFKEYSSATLNGFKALSADPYKNAIIQAYVGARYGSRSSDAFRPGDRVVVKIFNNDFEDPDNVVVGFLDNPRTPWSVRLVEGDFPQARKEFPEGGEASESPWYGGFLSIDVNLCQAIRDGKTVDVLWHGCQFDETKPIGDDDRWTIDHNGWQQSARFWEFPTTWRQTWADIDGSLDPGFQGSPRNGPPQSAFCWTSGLGRGVNGLDTPHFFFTEDAKLCNLSGEPNWEEYWLAENDQKNIVTFWNGGNNPDSGDGRRWHNRPIQVAVYVDGILVLTMAQFIATTWFESSLYNLVPNAGVAPVPWYAWPGNPQTDSPVFKYPEGFQLDGPNLGYGYWEAFEGPEQRDELCALSRPDDAASNRDMFGSWNGGRRISDRVKGYTLRIPPALGDAYPLPPPPYEFGKA